MDTMDSHIIGLLGEYLTGEISDSRRKELEQWLDMREENRRFFERFCQDRSFRKRWEMRQRIDTSAAIRAFDCRTGGMRHGTLGKRWLSYVAVAAVLVVAVGVSVLYFWKAEVKPEVVEVAIVPGSSKAVLVLADGKEVALGVQDSQAVALAGGGQAINQGTQLSYQGNPSEEVHYNELRVPRGGEYEVVLADGTFVKLNAASSLKYPETFVGKERVVELSGEAFFQVAKSAEPFLVKVGDMTVKVYGTTFNIHAYGGKRIYTALVEGKVGVTVKGNEKEYFLAPLQMADLDVATGKIEVKEVDLTSYIAWTKGEFIFTNERLEQMMETLSLWYDMEVIYQNPALKDLHFTGYLKRYQSIDQILKALSHSVGVAFKKRGKTLIISN